MLRVLVLFLLITPKLCLAIEEGSISTSTATVVPSPFTATYFSVTRMESVLTDAAQERNGPISINQLFLSYKFHKSYFAGIVLGYELQPRLMDKSYFFNPALRFGDAELIHTKTVNLFSDVRLVIPMNEDAGRQKLRFALQTTHIFDYKPLNSNFSVSSFNLLRRSFFAQNIEGRNISFYSRTTLSYKVSEYFGPSLVTVIQAYQLNKPDSEFLSLEAWRVGPGFYWTPSKSIKLSPFIGFKTNQLSDAALFLVALVRLS